MSDIKSIIASINKKYGENSINFVSKMANVEVDRLSSGSLALDYVIGQTKGVYGWPMGRIVELFGLPSSGKSLISLYTIIEAQKQNIPCIYLDAENSFDPDFAKRLGVDVDKLILSQVSIGEEMLDMLAEILSSGEKMVIVVDSVASMVPIKEMEDSSEQANIALSARMMSRGLRKLNALNKKALLLFLNQIRTNVGAYGNPETTTGGLALKHYTSIRLEVRMGEPLKEKDKQVGQTVKFKVKKNKSGKPFGDGYFKFYYDDRLMDKIDELVTLGLINKKIEQNGASYQICGRKFRGREAVEMELENDPKFLEEVKKEVFAK